MRSFVLLLTVLLVAGCLQTPPRQSNDVPPNTPQPRQQTGGSPDTPAWTVNDHWVMRSYPQGNEEATVEVIDHFVQAIDILRSSDADMDAFRVVSQDGNTTTWYRLSDLALMKNRHVVDGSELVETIYERPCAWYTWPLEVGRSWEDDCLRTTGGTTSKLTFNATIEGEETISVPSMPGNFTTFRIHYTGHDDETVIDRTEYFAPAACFPARTVTVTTNGTLVEDLIAHQCTAAG